MTSHVDASVIICVYNRPNDVRRCVESLFAMDAVGYEIILVDDASTDDTPTVLQELAAAAETADVVIETAPKNLGVSGARNRGLDRATRPIVAYTDSDCTVDAGWLPSLVASLDDKRFSAAAGVVIDDPPTNIAEHAFFGCRQIGQHTLQGRWLIGGNMALRTDILREFRFDDALTYGCDEDDLARRLVDAGHEFASASDAIVYHHHPLTLTDYWRQAWKQGRGSAHYWRKTGRWFGRDVALLLVALLTLPFALFPPYGWIIPAALACLQVVAVAWNLRVLKQKRWSHVLALWPLECGYTVVKLVSVIKHHVAGKRAACL